MSGFIKREEQIGNRKYYVFETEVGGKTVSVEIGKYAEQANGSCIVRCGETVVMTNVTVADKPRDGIDFFPLGVDYEEKMYAVGKIPGGFQEEGGESKRQSHSYLKAHRPTDTPAFPERISE